MAADQPSPELLQAIGASFVGAGAFCLLVATPEGSLCLANPGARAALGLAGAPVKGVDLLGLIHPDDRTGMVQLLSGAGSPDRVLVRLPSPDDSVRALVLSAALLVQPEGPRVLLFGRDASVEITREARVRAAERFEVVGQLASGVAHELNNALSTVTTLGDLLLAGVEPGSEVAEDLKDIKDSALDAAAVIRKLDLFAGGGRSEEPGEVHIPEVVRGARKLLARFLTRGVTLEMELDEATPVVRATPVMVEEILFALAASAKGALAGEGTMKVAVRPGGSSEAPLAVLEMSDTGRGVRMPEVEQAVEAFFSTRPLSQGTGVGLARVHRIVTGLDGTLRLTSPEGGGAVATVELPGVPTVPDAPLQEED